MKIYNVTFNDGGWHTALPRFTTVANSKDEAIENVLRDNPSYRKGYDKWASEFKIEYVIEVYDEKSYNRDKNIKKIID